MDRDTQRKSEVALAPKKSAQACCKGSGPSACPPGQLPPLVPLSPVFPCCYGLYQPWSCHFPTHKHFCWLPLCSLDLIQIPCLGAQVLSQVLSNLLPACLSRPNFQHLPHNHHASSTLNFSPSWCPPNTAGPSIHLCTSTDPLASKLVCVLQTVPMSSWWSPLPPSPASLLFVHACCSHHCVLLWSICLLVIISTSKTRASKAQYLLMQTQS